MKDVSGDLLPAVENSSSNRSPCKDGGQFPVEDADDRVSVPRVNSTTLDVGCVNEEIHQLSEFIFLFQNEMLSLHGNVFKGEIKSGVYGTRSCAIKLVQNSEQISSEAEILNNLSCHTHVISLIASGICEDILHKHAYLVLEKCHEQNLRQLIMSEKGSEPSFDLTQSLEYCKQIVKGVTYVHEKLIIHKDLKPSNILLTLDKKTIKIADFGLSQKIKTSTSRVFCKRHFGTTGYRPVESFGNSWVSLKSDIFSLGAVLYFVLTNGKSPFGDEISLWIYNTRKGLTDLSQLLVANTKAFRHLLGLMLNQERCCRPSIWQVADHPCWSGKDVECDFDYGFAEETDDSEVIIPTTQENELLNKETEREDYRKLLSDLERMGIAESSISCSSIVVFDGSSKRMQRFDPRNMSVTAMQRYHEDMMEGAFSAAVLGDYVYIFRIQSAYRLEYKKPTAIWERIEDLIEDHGIRPPVVATSEAIYFTGSATAPATQATSKFDPSLNQWVKVKDKKLITHSSALVASREYIYCVGGFAERIDETGRSERYSTRTKTWDEVTPMPTARYHASAAECNGMIYVAGGRDHKHRSVRLVERYDPETDQWTNLKPLTKVRWGAWFRCHVVGGNIYAVAGGGQNQTVEKYDADKNEWEVIEIPGDVIWVRASVSLKMR